MTPGSALKGKIGALLSSSRLLFIFAGLMIFMAVHDLDFFYTGNLLNIFSHVSINGILAVGMTMLMISRAFDISIGSAVVLAGVISIEAANHFHPAVAILLGIASGIPMGLFNGFLVAVLKINSFIATLGTMVIYQGIAFVITGEEPITTDSLAFQKFATLEVLGIPVVIIYFISVTVIIWSILRFSLLGKNAYAIGGNEDACRMLGISVRLHLIVFFVISGLCASFAGVILSSRINAASGTFGENIALVVIASIVLGGVHLSGGVGTIFGVLQGVILLGLLENITLYLGLFGYYQRFVRSLILIGVVVFDVIYIEYSTQKLQFRELGRLKSVTLRE
jgi:ribose transport system permease protein